MNDLFKKATRMKLRFNFKGQTSVEDLWDLTIQSLNAVYQGLSSEAKALENDSLLEIKSRELETNELKRAIVKYIFSVKTEERKKLEDDAAIAQKRHRIMDIIDQKQYAELANMPIEELEKML